MNTRRFSALSICLLCYTLLVILWGAYVRITGSGAGCGSHWPLCNGEIVPRSASVETLIEYSHRITSGLAFLGALALFYFSRRLFTPTQLVYRASKWAMVFMVLEALVGAALVLLELVGENTSLARAVVIGLHLINSLLLSGSLALTSWWSLRPQARVGMRSVKKLWLYLFCGVSLLLVGSSGAITALGDTLFPVSSLSEGVFQDLDPSAHFLLRLRVFHPLLAVLTSLVLIGMATAVVLSERSQQQKKLASALGTLVLLQITLGFANLLLLAPLALQLGHLLLANLVWASFLLLGAAEFELPPAYDELSRFKETATPQLRQANT